MDKVTASGLLLCAAALMALAGGLMLICASIACGAGALAAALCMLGGGLAMRASDKDVSSGEQRR